MSPTPQRERTARWRANNPDRAREVERNKAARREAAERLLRDRFAREYGQLFAEAGEQGLGGNRRRRAATKALREKHPRVWRECLDEARRADERSRR